MRLAFCLFKYFPYGGLQRDFQGIAQACLKAGFEIDVYVLAWQGEKNPEFTIHEIQAKGFSNYQRYRDYADQVAKSIAANDYAAVIGFNKIPYLNLYFAADSCYKHYLDLQRPWVYRWLPRSRSMLHAEKQVFGRNVTNVILSLTDNQIHEITASYQTPPHRFYLLPPWIKPDRFFSSSAVLKRTDCRQHYQIGQDDWLVITIGSGFRTKGVDRALLAIASLPEPFRKKVHYFIIGQDKASRFQRQVKRLHLEKQVRFLGGSTHVPDFLFAADLLLHPAYRESAGIVLLESVVSGLPVLTTASCGYAHYIKEANAGIVLEEPFLQQDLNTTLATMLSTLSKQPWSENGIRFGLKHPFDRMPAIACERIIQFIEHYDIQQTDHLFVWQDKKKSPCLAVNDVFTYLQNLPGQIFREVAGRKTYCVEINHEQYFIKFHTGVGWLEIIKNILCFRKPVLGAEDEFYALQRLYEAGIRTLEVVAAGWKGKNPAKRVSFLMTKALMNTENLENILAAWEVNPLSIKQQYALVKEVAKLARRMHEKGICHRDFYSCHILINTWPNSQRINFDDLQVSVLDLHRAQLYDKIPLRWRVKDISSLFFSVLNTKITSRHWLYFLREYEQLPLRRLLQERKSFLKQITCRVEKLQSEAIRKRITIAGKSYERRILV